MEKAIVFNIERFATEDGPGIRTVVFLKGCALHCRWCANPESQSFEKQILFNANVCEGCARCINICPKQAIEALEGYGFITTGPECNQCGTCIDNCYVNARSQSGTDYTSQELIEELLKDKSYYKMSGGGITFSGGEPFYYSAFIEECSQQLKTEGITTLVETCGHVPGENIKGVHNSIDYIFYDFKHIDPQKHKEFTGSDNKLILKNLEWLNENYTGFLAVRYPYIPTCNDDPEAIEGFLDYIGGLKKVSEVWFLPYHRLGIPKYQGLGRIYEMGDMKSQKFEEIAFLKDYEKRYNVKIKI